MKDEMVPCPRCTEMMPSRRAAVSRVDNETRVCSQCGLDEAVTGIVPIASWPISREAMVIRLQEWEGEGIGTTMSVGDLLRGKVEGDDEQAT